MRFLFGCLILLVGTTASAQSGSLRGDIYLQMKNGDVRQGVGRTVTLIPASAAFKSELKQVCGAFQKSIRDIDEGKDRLRASIYGADSKRDEFHIREAQERIADVTAETEAAQVALGSIARIGVRVGGQSAKSGATAKYAFPVVKPGSYNIFTTWKLYDTDYVWWTQVRVAARAVRQDLDNEEVLDLSLRSSVEIICKLNTL